MQPPPPPPSSQSLTYLFGGSKPWNLSDWTPCNDSVRGGASTSRLEIRSCSEGDSSSSATFHGRLDTQALCGAGFASQRTTSHDLGLDLTGYAGLALDVVARDAKTYTLVLRENNNNSNNSNDDNDADREQKSTVGWEAHFTPPPLAGQSVSVLLRWDDFRLVYRGRERTNVEPLRRGHVKRVTIMMRSFFGKQEGDFELVIRSIAAFKEEAESRYRDDPDGRRSMEGVEKLSPTVPPRQAPRQAWLAWIFCCV